MDGNHRSENSGTLCCPTCGARQEWSGFQGGRDRIPGEGEEPWVAFCWREVDPLGEGAFTAWAERIWFPLLEHRREEGR